LVEQNRTIDDTRFDADQGAHYGMRADCDRNPGAGDRKIMSMDAGSIMNQPVVVTRPEHTVAAVANLLATKGISAVPVCDDSGSLLGMISEGDLLRPFGLAHALGRAWWLEVLANGGERIPKLLDYLRANHRSAQDLMSKPVVTVTERATLGEIAELFLRHRIKRVPVVRNGKIVGVVSRADLVRAMASNPEVFDSTDRVPPLVGENTPAPYLRGNALGSAVEFRRMARRERFGEATAEPLLTGGRADRGCADVGAGS
jgi:CBS domain-containing protein